MRTGLALALAAAALALAPATATAGAAPPPAGWLGQDGPAFVLLATRDTKGLYPAEARRRREEGWGLLACEVDAAAHVSGCKVIGESQPLLGFGAAALAYFGAPAVSDLVGQPQPAGEPVVVRVRFGFQHEVITGTQASVLEYPTVTVFGRFGSGRLPDEPVGLGDPRPLPAPQPSPPASPEPMALPPPPPRPSVVTAPQWLSKPTGEDLARLYPEAAARQEISGRGVISCTVTRAGTLKDCVVVAEDPPGMGFGEAALGAAPLFRLPATVDGVPTEGRTVRIPISFRLG